MRSALLAAAFAAATWVSLAPPTAVEAQGFDGDRFFADEGSAALPSLRTVIVENFDAAAGWSARMSADDGKATLRDFRSPSGGVLGLKVEFFRRSPSVLLLTPPEPIPVSARCVMLSLRALGRNFHHEVSIVLLDYYGRVRELPLGRLDFSGWRTLSAYVPLPDPAGGTGIVQDDRHYPRRAGLHIAGLKLSFDADEAHGSFYAYFDELTAMVEGIEAGPAGPRTVAAPAASPAVDAARPPETTATSERILATLSARIAAALDYPPVARRRGIEGGLVVAFSVDERGDLTSARVDKSSGSEILDAAGLELLRSVFPVANDSGKALELRIAIAYTLSSAR